MYSEDKLFKVADRQQGYFTSQQAEESGISRSNFHYRIRSGEWVKVLRGLYRLARYPVTDRPELVIWALWSRDKCGNTQGVWSHQTALEIHELGDVMPAKMHMTVPLHFRRRSEIPTHLVLHFSDLSKGDKEAWQGFEVTTPSRTIIDVIQEGVLSEEQILEAIHEAIHGGKVLLQELDEISYPKLKKYKRLYADKYII